MCGTRGLVEPSFVDSKSTALPVSLSGGFVGEANFTVFGECKRTFWRVFALSFARKQNHVQANLIAVNGVKDMIFAAYDMHMVHHALEQNGFVSAG